MKFQINFFLNKTKYNGALHLWFCISNIFATKNILRLCCINKPKIPVK